MIDEQSEMLIEKFFDGTLTPAERAEFDRLVSSDSRMKRRVDDSALVHSFFQMAPRFAFARSFAVDVVRDAQEEAAMGRLLSGQKALAFSSEFRRRVMAAIDGERSEANHFLNRELTEFLARLFPRIAMPALVASCVAAMLNLNTATANTPLIDALLGLPNPDGMEVSLVELYAG